NNAGFGVPGELCDIEWHRHRDTIEVMATAPVHLCHLFAPAMQQRGSGHIINVSSLSAILPPHAGGTLYYPVKAFLHKFSIAFRAEMRSSGVWVTSLCPGFTRTGFQQAAGGTVEKVTPPTWTWSDPDAVARAGIRAVERNKPICVPGLLNKIIALLFKVLPGSVGRLLVRG
ncbi:MAG: SDR family NAD(P)-dependent oxidoreductase, partial [Roseobacter sp.]